MRRNLDRRVEAVTPIEDKSLKNRIETILETYLNNNVNCWEMDNKGAFRRSQSKSSQDCAQSKLMDFVA